MGNVSLDLPEGAHTLSPFKRLKEMEYLKGIKSYIIHFNATMKDGGEE
jgi:hypothetical protein